MKFLIHLKCTKFVNKNTSEPPELIMQVGVSFTTSEFKNDTQLPEVFNQTAPVTIRMEMPIRHTGTDNIFPPAVPKDILNK